MWQLTHVKATNIVSFKELDIEVAKGVCTLIYGINEDNENQKNNGTGKSSIVEAIAFGITGESLKMAPSINDIINNYAEEASVSLSFHSDYDGSIFIVERFISREGAQRISCRFGNESDGPKEAVLSSVLEYNRYILRVLGITKDQLYSCYLLNNSRFKSFFKASDKDKKEIINTFSNGVLVDQAIARLEYDTAPVVTELQMAKDETLKCQSGLEAIEEQIKHVQEQDRYDQEHKISRINDLKDRIAEKRNLIQSRQQFIINDTEQYDTYSNVIKWLNTVEDNEEDMLAAYDRICDKFESLDLKPISDYADMVEKKHDDLKTIEKSLKDSILSISNIQKEYEKVQSEYDIAVKNGKRVREDYDNHCSDTTKKIEAIDKEIDKLDIECNKLDKRIKQDNKLYAEIGVEISKLKAQVGGAITCPNCKHKFLLDTEKSLDALEVDIANKISDQDKLRKDIENNTDILDKMDAEYDNKEKQIELLKKGDNELRDKLDNLREHVRSLKTSLQSIQGRLSDSELHQMKLKNNQQLLKEEFGFMKNKMFDEAEDAINAKVSEIKKKISESHDLITSHKASIEAYQKTIKDIETATESNVLDGMRKSKEEYHKALQKATEVQSEIQARYDELISQKDYFVRFKSALANNKIESIAELTNSFLEQIGSDLRIELNGYKVLKSKKIREKITMNILRNGEDQGAFEKLSGGERARIVLAGILAMQHLTNSNCDNGKGLDLVILDEVLDASDSSGIMSYAEAINDLGITALMVSQIPVNDNYPYCMIVRKEGSVSSIIK